MKKILFRKLSLDYLRFFLIALFSSSIVLWVFQAVNYLDIMIEDGRDYLVYVNYSLLNFPKILNKLFPFVLFFSLFQITAKYENNNELIIFWTFGINKLQIINFIFKISIILTMIQIVMSSLIIPKTQDLARSFIKNSKVNFVGNFIKPQRFNDTIKNVTLYSEKKDDKGNLYNLYLKKQQGDTFEISYAKKGEFKLFNNIPVLVLFDGATINGKKDKITNISFSKSDFPINNFESNTATYKKTQEMNSLDLIKCVRYLNTNLKKVENIINCSKNNLSNVYKELYKRFIIPFYIPLLVLVALLIILSSKENINYNKIKIFTFLLGLFFIIFSETTIKMISEIIYNNIMISFLPFLFVIIIYLVFLKKTSFHKLNENLH
jgi:lipopolysaccharide export system permease protein